MDYEKPLIGIKEFVLSWVIALVICGILILTKG